MATIVIEKETRNKLRKTGRKEQTYDDIINELLEKRRSSVGLVESTEQRRELN